MLTEDNALDNKEKLRQHSKATLHPDLVVIAMLTIIVFSCFSRIYRSKSAVSLRS